MNGGRMKTMIFAWNDGWEFTEHFSTELFDPACHEALRPVRLPHTVRETPVHYFDEHCYQLCSGYRRLLTVPAEWEGKRVLLRFSGVAHSAWVYCNGIQVAEHHCGYTAFTAELTGFLRYGAENLIAVKVDSRENQNIPPFGHVIDYMTYGGIYREVQLEVRPQTFLADVCVRPEVSGALRSIVRLDGPCGETERLRLRQRVRPRDAGVLAEYCAEKRFVADAPLLSLRMLVPEPRRWDVDAPALYVLDTELLRDGVVLDRVETVFGFRSAEFRADGFYLNGRKLRLRGLNRHQSYPYVGYAMPRSMQRFDAEVLKKELGVNAVRTSHYPQSQHFLTRCDELGLLVFTEIPGWQHIGDGDWKLQAVKNVEDMVTQYRNHPSIILWGVRINESLDDDALYHATNDTARLLDPTRPTGGVRYLQKSSFLEDVYTFNDFLHDGTNAGCRKKAEVTPDVSRAYLISEYNGHMFPTKSFDSEDHRRDHALRHAAVLNAVAGEPDIAGSFGWCMFDYNTHKDFGSGDRVCYHGVLDMFRNPKPAAWVYASQQEETPVLSLSSTMDIGEHPGGLPGAVYLFTNADSVRMYRGEKLVREFRQEDSPYRNLAHGPICVDDYVGDRLIEEEGYSPRQSALVKPLLNYAARYGINRLPAAMKVRAMAAMTAFRMNFSEVYRLYQKYIGDWGGEAAGFRFEAVKDGAVVAVRHCAPVTEPHITASVSHTRLVEDASYDVAAVRVRVCDGDGNVLPFWNLPLPAAVYGPAELIGPQDRVWVAGGMGGCYLRTLGQSGTVTLRLRLPEEFDPEGQSVQILEFEAEA